MKAEIRVIGFDDAPFKRGDKETWLVGVIYRGSHIFEGLLLERIGVDGFDVNERIIGCVRKSRFFGELRAVMTSTTCFAGFNIVDLELLSVELGVPAISVSREMPNMEKVMKALKNVENWEERVRIMEKNGRFHKMEVRGSKLYFQFKGASKEEVERIVRACMGVSRIPEPVRVAHLIAHALVFGESKGRA